MRTNRIYQKKNKRITLKNKKIIRKNKKIIRKNKRITLKNKRIIRKKKRTTKRKNKKRGGSALLEEEDDDDDDNSDNSDESDDDDEYEGEDDESDDDDDNNEQEEEEKLSDKITREKKIKIDKAKVDAQSIIDMIDGFLKDCKIGMEEHEEKDGSVTIYLYIKGVKSKKIYFYYTNYLITDDTVDIETRRNQSSDEQQILFIKTTQCILNGFGFSIIIQAYIMANSLLKDIFYAKKEDTTDAATIGSVRNINHILGFWNNDPLELDFEEVPSPLSDMDGSNKYDDEGYLNEKGLKLHATDSTKIADIIKSCTDLVHYFESYLQEKNKKFKDIKKTELIEEIDKNKESSKTSGWVFSGPS